MKTLVLSFFATNPKYVKQLENQWKERDTLHQNFYGRKKEQSERLSDIQLGGSLMFLDLNDLTKFREVETICPFGMEYVSSKQKLIVTSGNAIISMSKLGKVKAKFTNALFNDLHSISLLQNNDLLVTSTGTDSIFILDSKNYSVIKWEWLATENGYDTTPSGKKRIINKNARYDNIVTSTTEHTTHVNSAILFEDNIIATLFHQGEIVQINLQSKKVKILVKGLKCPHSIRKTSFGFTVCDTADNSIKFLSDNFEVIKNINHNFNWVQDAIIIDEDRIVIADSNNSRVLVYNYKKEVIISEFKWCSMKISCMVII
jgi:hypothetical protein